MCLTRKTIGVAACLSLVMLQLSGLHLHADAHGYIGGPETSYSHTHTHDHHGADHHDRSDAADGDDASSAPGHDYDDARDVSLLDLALNTFKSTLAILAFVLLLPIAPRVRALACADLAYPILSGRHTRWRPPLRAPPPLASI